MTAIWPKAKRLGARISPWLGPARSRAAARYRACGLTIDPDRIITSGLLLKGHFAAQRLVGARCAVLGPGDSLRYVEDAGGRIVSPSDAFDVLVIADESGFPFLETVDATLSALFHALDRRQRVHLLLANPDLKRAYLGL